MKASQLRQFTEPGIIACALQQEGEEYMEIDGHGVLTIPPGVELKGFHLLVAVKEGGRTFVVQKEVGTEGGGYGSAALSELRGFAPGFRATILRDPIEVIRAGGNTWTGWHKNAASNRVDCWHLGVGGELWLYQIGVLTHDNGRTFVLHGEFRWRGWLHDDCCRVVGLPAHFKWGSLEGGSSNRTQIFHHPDFIALMKDVKLPKWGGTVNDLDPRLPKIPDGNFAVVDWFITFAGQTGQGIAKFQNGKSAWVHGIDVEGFRSDSFEPPLWRGDIISFEESVENWGKKQNAPPKLTGVRLVKRAW